MDIDKRLKTIESSYISLIKESQSAQRYGDIISYILAGLRGEYVKNFEELYDFITSINLSYTINEKLTSRVRGMFTIYDFPTEKWPLAIKFIDDIENFIVNMGYFNTRHDLDDRSILAHTIALLKFGVNGMPSVNTITLYTNDERFLKIANKILEIYDNKSDETFKIKGRLTVKKPY